MAAKPREYRRLAGRHNLGWTRNSLWIGPDHLLKISIRSYEEHYRRYYYKDIQALTIVRTDGWIGINVLWVFLIIVFTLFSAFSQSLLLAACSVGPLGLLLAVNLMLGPTCKFQIRTAVQTDTVEAVRRVNAAWKVIGKLHPLLMEVQGDFTEADLATIEAQAPQAAPVAAPPEAADAPAAEANLLENLIETEEYPALILRPSVVLPEAAEAKTGEAKPEDALPAAATPSMPPMASAGAMPSAPPGPPPLLPRTRVAMAAMAVTAPGGVPSFEGLKTPGCKFAFSVLMFDGFHSLAQLAFHNVALVIMGQASYVVMTVGVIVALARLPHQPIFSALRRTLGWALAYLVVFTTGFAIWSSTESIKVATSPGTWERIRALAGQSTWDSPPHLSACLISLLLSWAFALVGFRQLRALRATSRPCPAAAPTAGPLAPPEPASQES